MKNSKNKVIEVLKDQMKAEKEYNNKFIEARKLVAKREQERLTDYDKFKRTQYKETKANEMLVNYLSK
jgi:hypothetical protein